MLAVAAGLWFLYLVPTWVRRREYLATERTATRIQQTMRVLAETAEVPESVRIAATAREAAAPSACCAPSRREWMPWSGVPRIVAPSAHAPYPPDRQPAHGRGTDPRSGADLADGDHGGDGRLLAGARRGTLAAGGVAIAVQRRLDVQAMPRAVALGPLPHPVCPARGRAGAASGRPGAVDPGRGAAAAVPLEAGRAARAAGAAGAFRPEAAVVDERPAAPVTPLRADPPAAARASRYAAMGIVDPADTLAPTSTRYCAAAAPPADAVSSFDAHQEYEVPGLADDASGRPHRQLAAWFRDAEDAGLPDPNAMVVGTIEPTVIPRRARCSEGRRREHWRSTRTAIRRRAGRSRTSRGWRCCSPGTGCTGRCGSRARSPSRLTRQRRVLGDASARIAARGMGERAVRAGRHPGRTRRRQTRPTRGSTGSRACRARRIGADIW